MKSFPTVKKQPCSARSTGSLGCVPSTKRESKNAHPAISATSLKGPDFLLMMRKPGVPASQRVTPPTSLGWEVKEGPTPPPPEKE